MTPPAAPRDLPCLACGVVGREGRDVMFKIVEVAEEERREVSVLLPVHHAADSLEMPTVVPERYASEPRCRDERACAERVRAWAEVPTPEPEPEVGPPVPDELEVDEPEDPGPPRQPAEPEAEYVL